MTNDNPERCLYLDDFENLDLASHVQHEGISRQIHCAENTINTRRVNNESSTRLETGNIDIGANAHRKSKSESIFSAICVSSIDPCSTRGIKEENIGNVKAQDKLEFKTLRPNVE